MKRLSTAIALFSIGTELRAGRKVDTTAKRYVHHCTDTRNAIKDFRRFYEVDIESIYVSGVSLITGRKNRYIDTYKLIMTDENVKKMDDLLKSLALEIEEQKAKYQMREQLKRKSGKTA